MLIAGDARVLGVHLFALLLLLFAFLLLLLLFLLLLLVLLDRAVAVAGVAVELFAVGGQLRLGDRRVVRRSSAPSRSSPRPS